MLKILQIYENPWNLRNSSNHQIIEYWRGRRQRAVAYKSAAVRSAPIAGVLGDVLSKSQFFRTDKVSSLGACTHWPFAKVPKTIVKWLKRKTPNRVGKDHLESSGSGIIWDHLVWNHLVSSWIIWDHLRSSGIIYGHLGRSHLRSSRLGSFGIILDHLESSGLL